MVDSPHSHYNFNLYNVHLSTMATATETNCKLSDHWQTVYIEPCFLF